MAVPIPGDIDDLNPNIPTINDQLAEAYKWFQYVQQVLINSQKTWPQSDNSDHASSTSWVREYVTNAALSTQIPGQSGNAGKVLGTDGTTASWVKGGIITPVIVTANYSVSGANANSNKTDLLRLSGTFTLSFPTPSTLGNGFFLYARNEGSGDVTISPTGTVDGIASFVMYPAETRLFYTDGTNLFSLVLTPFKKIFTGSGNHIDPPGYVDLYSYIRSGGGSSGTCTNNANATVGGGGGGGSPMIKLPTYTPGSVRAVVVGNGAVVGASSGNTGGTSSIGGISVVGGGGGIFSTTLPPGGNGGDGGGDSTYTDSTPGAGGNGGAGGKGWYGGGGGCSGTSGALGGSSVYGGGGGGGGQSRFGGAGGARGSGAATPGAAGVYPGGGGGGNAGPLSVGGAGAAGNVETWGTL